MTRRQRVFRISYSSLSYPTSAIGPDGVAAETRPFDPQRLALIILILLGVVTLAVLVMAFFASKYWHWAHVLVLVLFYFASVGYALLAARSLDMRLENQEKLAKAEIEIEKQETLIDALKRGSDDPQVISQLAGRDTLAAQEEGDLEGTIQLGHDLRMINRIRGRVWRGARKADVDQQTGQVTVNFPLRPSTTPTEDDQPEPEEAPAGPPPELGLVTDAIVYLFEQGPMEGSQESGPRQYLGEFRVDSVTGREAVLEPLDQLELDNTAAERLLDSKGPWIVYETMPADDRDLFADMDEETLRRLLPAESVEEYLRDGTPATPDDPPARLVGIDADGNIVPPDEADEKAVSQQYRRRLRDYAYLLNDYERERAELVAREQAITEDLAKLADALENAKAVEAYRQQELAKWQADLTAVKRDREAVEEHVAALERQIANAKRLLADTLRENAQLAEARLDARGVLTPIGSGAIDIDAL